jgi:hypothetical protein
MPKAMVDTRQRVLPPLNSVTHTALVEAAMEAWNIPTNFFFEACSDNILYTRQTVFFVDANTIVLGMSPGDFKLDKQEARPPRSFCIIIIILESGPM